MLALSSTSTTPATQPNNAPAKSVISAAPGTLKVVIRIYTTENAIALSTGSLETQSPSTACWVFTLLRVKRS